MDRFSLLLVIVGAINWGLVGLFQFDLIAFLFGGQAAMISRVLYTIVGAAGLALEHLHALHPAGSRAHGGRARGRRGRLSADQMKTQFSLRSRGRIFFNA